jgi:hypothetical protein
LRICNKIGGNYLAIKCEAAESSGITKSGRYWYDASFMCDANGLILSPENYGGGLFFTPAGIRYAMLVAIMAMAQSMHCQQTSKTSQKTYYGRKKL